MQIAENKNQRFAQTSARKFVQNDEPYETGRAPPARPVFSFSPIPHFLLDSAPYRDSPRISRNPHEPRISHLITTSSAVVITFDPSLAAALPTQSRLASPLHRSLAPKKFLWYNGSDTLLHPSRSLDPASTLHNASPPRPPKSAGM